MINLTNLATVPEKQGRGYGTALVRHVTAQVPLHLIRYSIARFAHKDSLWQADVQQCSTWLTSSNVVNTKFYESCGFLTVAEILLGDNNPMWGKPPIVVPVVGVPLPSCLTRVLNLWFLDGEKTTAYQTAQ